MGPITLAVAAAIKAIFLVGRLSKSVSRVAVPRSFSSGMEPRITVGELGANLVYLDRKINLYYGFVFKKTSTHSKV